MINNGTPVVGQISLDAVAPGGLGRVLVKLVHTELHSDA
jgi:hypothetical protein